MYRRRLAIPSQSFFLFGVRGAGKSSWVRTVLPDALVFDLLDEALLYELMGEPGRFRTIAVAAPAESWIVVDEVQRMPSLLNEVHRLIEEGRRFALLGSSARKLRAGGVNLLAGRALHKQMFPLLPEELGSDFDLEAVLRHGSLAVVWTAKDRRAVLESYVHLYLREEIRAEANLRNLPGFVRLLPVAALLHGQQLSVASIARDAGVARTTVSGYLEVLEDTLLTWRLSAFAAKLRVRERRRPKLYWVDPGLVRAMRRHLGPVGPEEAGPLFEGWILGLLRAYRDDGPLYEDLGYWSPAGGRTEVDAVLVRGDERMAIEIKASHRFHSSQVRGLQAIADLPGLVRRVLVYRGDRALRTEGGIHVWPVRSFLEALETGQLWP